METVLRARHAIERHFVTTGKRPSVDTVAEGLGIDRSLALDAFRQLRDQRMLVLEPDEVSIRMMLPFSGVPTQHEVHAGGVRYFANCAWDALGIPAALGRPAEVRSRCEQSGEPLRLAVGVEGPEPSAGWLFHCPVPAARWWDDLVFT